MAYSPPHRGVEVEQQQVLIILSVGQLLMVGEYSCKQGSALPCSRFDGHRERRDRQGGGNGM